MSFHIGLTRDFLNPDGEFGLGDIGLEMLDRAPGVTWEFLAENRPLLGPDQLDRYDGVLVLAPTIARASVEGVSRLSVLARFGVGYDNVDISACSERGILVTITPDGVRRPVAVIAITLLLALTHRLLQKDRLTRSGRWAEKLNFMGQGVTGRTLGLVGFGNIGREILRLAQPFEMRHLVFDPHVSPDVVRQAGAEAVGLEGLLEQSDYVVICCALTADTRHLINANRLRLMKPNGYLINVARGPIVDQTALTEALSLGTIAGAGLDVFETEPVDPADPILELENVIVSPHALCWTDECFLGNGRSAIQSLLDVAAGRIPTHVVNRDATEHTGFKARLASYASTSRITRP